MEEHVRVQGRDAIVREQMRRVLNRPVRPSDRTGGAPAGSSRALGFSRQLRALQPRLSRW